MGLGGCSAVRLGYNQAPGLVSWWMSRYVDLDAGQRATAREAIDSWFAWHRTTQLPDYASLLERARGELAGPATPEQACRWGDDLSARLLVAYDHAVPALARLAMTLTPQQLGQMERKFAKNNEEFRDDFLQSDPRQRRRVSIERAVDQAESLYGRLDATQRERIAGGIDASPFDPERWLAERQARQQAVLGTVRRLQAEHASPAEAESALRQLGEDVRSSPREPYRRYAATLLTYNCRFAAELHNATRESQRLVAAKRLRGWEDDVRALSGGRGDG